MSVRIRRRGNASKALAKLKRALEGPDRVKVGFPAGQDQEIIDRAVYNEFGTEHIPDRPFMRNAVGANQRDYKKLLRNIVSDPLKHQNRRLGTEITTRKPS